MIANEPSTRLQLTGSLCEGSVSPLQVLLPDTETRRGNRRWMVRVDILHLRVWIRTSRNSLFNLRTHVRRLKSCFDFDFSVTSSYPEHPSAWAGL